MNFSFLDPYTTVFSCNNSSCLISLYKETMAYFTISDHYLLTLQSVVGNEKLAFRQEISFIHQSQVTNMHSSILRIKLK